MNKNLSSSSVRLFGVAGGVATRVSTLISANVNDAKNFGFKFSIFFKVVEFLWKVTPCWFLFLHWWCDLSVLVHRFQSPLGNETKDLCPSPPAGFPTSIVITLLEIRKRN